MGLSEIRATFALARKEKRPAFMPYWPLGYPDRDTSKQVIKSLVAGGADLIEVGIPFSDPLADGPVIQRASQVALEHGITVQGCIDLIRELRQDGVTAPFLAMGYLNPLLAYGVQAYVSALKAAGCDGLIVPDLPAHESAEIGVTCAANEMALVQFTSPTSTPQRVVDAVAHASGFIYIVAVTGVTGARDALASGLQDYVERVKRVAGSLPVAVGFGISKPEHVREVGQFADGVIVGAAVVRAAGEAVNPPQAAYDFVRYMLGKPSASIQ